MANQYMSFKDVFWLFAFVLVSRTNLGGFRGDVVETQVFFFFFRRGRGGWVVCRASGKTFDSRILHASVNSNTFYWRSFAFSCLFSDVNSSGRKFTFLTFTIAL